MSGIEVIGIVASVIQIADLGGRLSVKLCTFSRKVRHADQHIRDISKDVALTCNVLRELADNLKQDEESKIYSSNAVHTAEDVIKECMKVFTDLEGALDGNAESTKSAVKKLTSRFKYPFLEPHIDLMRSNLERLKSTLLLMLNVIIYAGQLRSKADSSVLREQQELIKTLNEEKKANDKTFEQLTKAIEGLQAEEKLPSSPATDSCFHANTLFVPIPSGTAVPVVSENVQTAPQPMRVFQDNVVNEPEVDSASRNTPPKPNGTPSQTNSECLNTKAVVSDELAHYCALVKNLLAEIEVIQYKINHGTRIRTRMGMLDICSREMHQLGKVHVYQSLHQATNQHLPYNGGSVYQNRQPAGLHHASSNQAVGAERPQCIPAPPRPTISPPIQQSKMMTLPPLVSRPCPTPSHPMGSPPPPGLPHGMPPGAVMDLPGEWQRSWGRPQYQGFPPPPPPPMSSNQHLGFNSGHMYYNRQPAPLHIPPPPPPSESQPLTSATYIPGEQSFGPGVGIPPLDSFGGYDYIPEAEPTRLPPGNRYGSDSMDGTGNRHRKDSNVPPTPTSRIPLSLPRRNTNEAVSPGPPTATVENPQAYEGLSTSALSNTPSTAHCHTSSTTSLGPASPNDPALQWPLHRVLEWLDKNKFSNDWRKTFENLGLQGADFLELGRGNNGRGNLGKMYQVVYPQLAKECSRSGTGWDQPREREEGKRMRKLIRRIADNSIPTPTDGLKLGNTRRESTQLLPSAGSEGGLENSPNVGRGDALTTPSTAGGEDSPGKQLPLKGTTGLGLRQFSSHRSSTLPVYTSVEAVSSEPNINDPHFQGRAEFSRNILNGMNDGRRHSPSVSGDASTAAGAGGLAGHRDSLRPYDGSPQSGSPATQHAALATTPNSALSTGSHSRIGHHKSSSTDSMIAKGLLGPPYAYSQQNNALRGGLGGAVGEVPLRHDGRRNGQEVTRPSPSDHSGRHGSDTPVSAKDHSKGFLNKSRKHKKQEGAHRFNSSDMSLGERPSSTSTMSEHEKSSGYRGRAPTRGSTSRSAGIGAAIAGVGTAAGVLGKPSPANIDAQGDQATRAADSSPRPTRALQSVDFGIGGRGNSPGGSPRSPGFTWGKGNTLFKIPDYESGDEGGEDAKMKIALPHHLAMSRLRQDPSPAVSPSSELPPRIAPPLQTRKSYGPDFDFEEREVPFAKSPIPQDDSDDDSDDGLFAIPLPNSKKALAAESAASAAAEAEGKRPQLQVDTEPPPSRKTLGLSVRIKSPSTASTGPSTHTPETDESDPQSARRWGSHVPDSANSGSTSNYSPEDVSKRRESISRDDIWASRLPVEGVIDHLDEFFPNIDLDEPYMPENPGSPGTSPTSASDRSGAEDTAPTTRGYSSNGITSTLNGDMSDTLGSDESTLKRKDTIATLAQRNMRKSTGLGRMKSIREVAKGANELGRNRSVAPSTSGANVATGLLRRKSTKMFGHQIVQIRPGPGCRMSTLETIPQESVPQDAVPKRQETFRIIRGNLIGKGTYGRVYLGMNANTGELLAVKQVEVSQKAAHHDKNKMKEMVAALDQEIDTMQHLEHPNIVQYLGCERKEFSISIYLEYISGGSIGSCLRKHGKFEESVVKSLTRQTLAGLAYLHQEGVLHRDLKADSILLDLDGTCKISDFGISKKTDNIYGNDVTNSMQGSVFWMAPEVIRSQGQGHSAKVDIWSLGCVVLEMFAGRRPWSKEEAIGAIFKLGNLNQAPPIPEDVAVEISPAALAFMLDCFTIDPSDRPSADTLLIYHAFCIQDMYYNFRDTELYAKIRPVLIDAQSISRTSPLRNEIQPDQVKSQAASVGVQGQHKNENSNEDPTKEIEAVIMRGTPQLLSHHATTPRSINNSQEKTQCNDMQHALPVAEGQIPTHRMLREANISSSSGGIEVKHVTFRRCTSLSREAYSSEAPSSTDGRLDVVDALLLQWTTLTEEVLDELRQSPELLSPNAGS